MNLKDYFETKKGRGVLATADDKGRVNAAIYARPHILDDLTVAFIMPDRLTHQNLKSNPHASYLFMEDTQGFEGIRLMLTKTREEQDSELLHSLRRKSYLGEKEAQESTRYLVCFKVDKILPLLGTGVCPVEMPEK